MKILITGGAGFVGQYCAKLCQGEGHDVTILDIAEPKFCLVHCQQYSVSMLSTDDVIAAIDTCDAVIHLAGVLGTSEQLDSPFNAAKVNILGSLGVFEACRRQKKRGVYIGVGNHWMNNTYSISKTAAERFALMYNAEHRTEIAVVRGLNAYGPGQKHKPVRKVIPNLVLPALRGEPLKIYGDGEQIMDFIYVEDLARILIEALVGDHGCYDTVIEAGSGRRTTINEVAAEIIRISGSHSEIQHVPMRPGETEHAEVVADVSTLECLDEFPDAMFPLSSGLKLTIDYYREHLDQYK
jgi:nucleoside-diphosphate-sugar epimerase